MAIDNSGLVYLFDSIFQIENLAGRPVCPGHIEVFVAGTDTKYITYQNFDGTRNPFKVPLNSDGRAVILVEAQFKYDVYIYDSFNNMICSRLNVAPAVGGDVSVSGLTEVYHDESLSGDGTPYAPLSVVSAGKVYSGIEPIIVNNDEDKISANTASFGVESPLYLSEDSPTATVVALNMSELEAALTGKADTTALNEVRDNMMSATAIGGVDNIITGYNGSAFSAGSTYSGLAPVIVDNENNTISVSSKELEAQAPLQITDVGSAYQLSITANINSPRTRVIEYGTDRWSDVKSAMDDVSAGNIDYIVMKYTDASGNEYYAPLDKYAPDAACHFVCPSNEQETVYGYGQRRKDTIFTINSGDQWVTRNVRPFIGRVIGGTNVTVDVQGEDYVISANGIDASATEAIDLVTANSGDWNGVSAKLDTTAFSTVSGDFLTAHQALPESANWNSTYNTVSVNSGSWSSRPQEPVSGINIDIFESAGKVVFSGMTGGGSTYTGDAQGALDEVYANSGDWNTITSKLDTTAFSTVSGDFITAHQALPDSANWNSTYNTVHDNSGNWTGGGGGGSYTGDVQGALDEVYTSSGTWDTVTGKLDSTAQVVTAVGTASIAGGLWPPTLTTYLVSSINGSAILPYGYSILSSNSAKWNSTYATVYNNSASWTGGGSDFTGLFQAQYGTTTYSDIKNAVDNNKIVYCKSGGHMAFLAYSGSNNYEFQYYRSLTGHTTAAQGDQVFVYTINNANTWSVTTRNTYTEIKPSAGLNSAFTNGTAAKLAFSVSDDILNATAHLATASAGWDAKVGSADVTGTAQYGLTTGGWIEITTGGDVPEGVLVESGLEYNAVNEISGYSGSAFAQPSISAAEWNSNYETVNTNSAAWGGNALPISAGPGVKVELIDGKLLFSTDETVLWTGILTSGNSINLSETVKNFQYVDYYGYDSTRRKSVYYRQDTTHITGGETNMFNIAFVDGNLDNHWFGWFFSQIKYDTTSYNSITNSGGNQIYANTETMAWTKNAGRYIILDKVIGVNRTAGGN